MVKTPVKQKKAAPALHLSPQGDRAFALELPSETAILQPYDRVATAYYVRHSTDLPLLPADDELPALVAVAEPVIDLTRSPDTPVHADALASVYFDEGAVSALKARLRKTIKRARDDRIALLRKQYVDVVPSAGMHDDKSETATSHGGERFDQRHITINIVVDGHETHLL